jgi:hypothetical protein
MAHRVNDDFCVGRLVQDEIWIGRRRDAPNGGVIGRRASGAKTPADCGESHFPYCRAEVDFSGFFLIRGAVGPAIYGTNATTSIFHIVGENISRSRQE